jgi:hypothetical protein
MKYPKFVAPKPTPFTRVEPIPPTNPLIVIPEPL